MHIHCAKICVYMLLDKCICICIFLRESFLVPFTVFKIMKNCSTSIYALVKSKNLNLV